MRTRETTIRHLESRDEDTERPDGVSVWIDPDGELHVSARALLTRCGWPDQPPYRELIIRAIVEFLEGTGGPR